MADPLWRRIRGLETEFGVTCLQRGGEVRRRLGADEIARQLFRSVVAWGKSSNVFLRNGGRLYLDVGSHPEYATAECDRFDDLLAQDRVGEMLVHELTVDARQRLADEGTDADIFVFKNNVDSHGNSYGCHENYLVGREIDLADQAELLVPFLVTRQLFAGAGHLDASGAFQLSQRADHMWDPVSSATTRTRPMINTRDEPHADPARFRRLHVIVGDSNMSETATWLKVITTDLVLRLIESGTLLGDLTLAVPGKAIRDVSRDLTGGALLDLASGRTITALEVQRRFHRACHEAFTAGTDAVDDASRAETAEALELWGAILDAFETDDLTRFADRLDWVAKYRLLSGFRERQGLEWNDARMAELALRYHDIDPQRGIAARLTRRGLLCRRTTDADVEHARVHAPTTTRAALRSRFLAAAEDSGVEHSVDWVNLRIMEQPERRWADTPAMTPRQVLLTDPFRAEDQRVDDLIGALQRFADER